MCSRVDRLILWGGILFLLFGVPVHLHAAPVRLETDRLKLGEDRFYIRGITYDPRPPTATGRVPAVPCQYARDLPLIAASGANTIRTFRLAPQHDVTFKSLLETTGLYWLAGFSLESYYDPEKNILDFREQILEDLRRFAERHLSNPSLLAFVIGEDVPGNYKAKFSGSVEDFYQLLGEAAASLRDLAPEDPPLVAAVVSESSQLVRAVPGLSFWIWKTQDTRDLPGRVSELEGKASAPVLVEASLTHQETASAEEAGIDPAEALLTSVRSMEAEGGSLGFSYGIFADDAGADSDQGLFLIHAGDEESWESLFPRPLYTALADGWEGRLHDEWRMQEPAQPERLVHAATGGDLVAPGTLARVTGSSLAASVYAANGVPWPLHQGETCLCLNGQPVPMGMASPESLTIHVPWDMAIGRLEAVYFRSGAASAPISTRVEQFAPGIFPNGVVREETACVVSADNGVRPGETLTIYATGLGPGEPPAAFPKVYVNGLEAEVLSSTLAAGAVGINQLGIRVAPGTPPSAAAALYVSAGAAHSPVYNVSIVRPADTFGLRLSLRAPEVLVQAGGPPAGLPVLVDGVRGYCGTVQVEALDVPSGVHVEPAAAQTGAAAQLEVRADPDAPPHQSARVRLRAIGTGTEAAELEARVTVLPSKGNVPLAALSNGAKSGFPRAQFRWNGAVIFDTAGGGPGRGVNVLSVDPASGLMLAIHSFDTWGDEQASQRLVEHLEELADGTLVLFSVADEGSLLLSQEARLAIARMFFSRYIFHLDYQQSWALIGCKGKWPMGESYSPVRGAAAWANVSFPIP